MDQALHRAMRFTAIPDYNTFRTFGDYLEWLDQHHMTVHDIARTIQRACNLNEGGATKDEIIRYVRTIHGIPPDESAWVEFTAAVLASRSRITRARGRYTAPPPTQGRLALVELPPGEEGLFQPYLYRGTAGWLLAED